MLGEHRLPHPRGQFGDSAGWVYTDTLQHVDQVGVGIDTLQAAGDQQTLDDPNALGTDFSPRKKEIFSFMQTLA